MDYSVVENAFLGDHLGSMISYIKPRIWSARVRVVTCPSLLRGVCPEIQEIDSVSACATFCTVSFNFLSG